MEESEDFQEADEKGLWFSENGSLTNPYRAEQMAALLAMIPFAEDAAFKIVDVGCGDGRLASCLLTMFPNCTWLGLEGSSRLRETAAERLQGFGGRAKLLPFRYAGGAFRHQEVWGPHIAAVDVVIASHFDLWFQGRPELFDILYRALSDKGAVLIAEMSHIETSGPAQWSLSEWLEGLASRNGLDEEQRISVEEWKANLELYFENWSLHQSDGPTVFERLRRLHDAGFRIVDYFWVRAGHCVYGGLRAPRYSFDCGRRERALKLAGDAFAL